MKLRPCCRLRTRHVFVAAGLALVGIMVWLLFPITAYLRFNDTEVDWFEVVVFRDDTEIAERFSEQHFRAIRQGEPASDVIQALGKPLDTIDVGEVSVWRYTRSPNDRSYFQRDVHIRKGRVLKTFAEHYID